MRGIRLQFLLLLAVLCAGLHAPALAHDVHDEHGGSMFELSDGHHGHGGGEAPQNKPADGPQELFHHHHCPMALAFESSGTPVSGVASREVLRPDEPAVLVSRATAPPTEPPLA